jgi:hypothetical protein
VPTGSECRPDHASGVLAGSAKKSHCQRPGVHWKAARADARETADATTGIGTSQQKKSS